MDTVLATVLAGVDTELAVVGKELAVMNTVLAGVDTVQAGVDTVYSTVVTVMGAEIVLKSHCVENICSLRTVVLVRTSDSQIETLDFSYCTVYCITVVVDRILISLIIEVLQY